jgi:hypothetical protein
VTKAGYHPGEGLVWLGLIAGGECSGHNDDLVPSRGQDLGVCQRTLWENIGLFLKISLV